MSRHTNKRVPADLSVRWPGGLLENGQPKLNAENDAAVKARREQRLTALSRPGKPSEQ